MTRSSQLRIAFIVEPLPVRSGPEDFKGPFLHFCKIAEALNRTGAAKTYLIAPDYLINQYKFSCHSIKGSALGFDQSWPRRWRQEWTNLLNGQDDNRTDFISQIISNELIDVVYIWSKNDTIRNASVRGGARVIHVELSPVRAPSGLYWLFDPNGVGPDSLASKMIMETECQKPSDKNLVYLLSDLISDQSIVTMSKSNEKKRVLIPLQLDQDINTILWNSYGNQYASLKSILKILSNYQEIELTVRAHPASKRDYSDLVRQYAPNANYVNGETSLWDTLSHWDGILHVNSSVGFEAELFSMKVCSLGASVTSIMTEPNNYNNKITSFLDEEIIKSDSSMRTKGLNNYQVLRKYFMIVDFIANKPSTYALIASSLGSFNGSTKVWFQSGGLHEASQDLQIKMLENEISILRSQNHHRILEHEISNLSYDVSLNYINELRSENQMRIDEINILRKKIDPTF